MRTTSLSLLCALAASLALPSVARADTASDAFNGWNSAFLAKVNGDTYYATTVITAGTQRQGTWVGALDIAIAEDRYLYTHNVADRQRVSDLMTTFVAKEGSSWIKNSSWNDDMAWMIIAGLRAYQITGNEAWLKIVTDTWNATYDRGWDTKYAGGGIWEDMGHITPWDKPSKCGLSNSPIASMGVVLYQITGDAAFLDKSKQIYNWVRKSMFIPATGQIYGCVGFATSDETVGKLEGGNNAYDSGSYIEMTDALYRVTGDDAYHQDTLKAIEYRIAKDAILHDGGRGEQQWGYRFTRGLSDYCNFNDAWPKYQTWLQNNADAAWSKRNALNITWDDWTKVTDMPGLPGVTHDKDVVALCTSSAAAIWQHFPPPTDALPTGTFELKNGASQLSLKVASKDVAAAVVQEAFSGGAESLWSFVPTAGNYYEIRNASSGLLLDITGPSSAKQGAKIVQSADRGLRPGTDRWLPVKNGDGTYTFYNLSGVFALDNPMGSTTAGTQLATLAGNDTAAQKFQLIAHEAAGASGAGGASSAVGTAGTAGAGSAETSGANSGGAPTSGVAGAGSGVAGSVTAAGGSSAGAVATSGASESDASGCSCRSAGSAPTSPTRASFALLGVVSALLLRRRSAR